MHLPLFSQSPKRVGSGPFGPPRSIIASSASLSKKAYAEKPDGCHKQGEQPVSGHPEEGYDPVHLAHQNEGDCVKEARNDHELSCPQAVKQAPACGYEESAERRANQIGLRQADAVHLEHVNERVCKHAYSHCLTGDAGDGTDGRGNENNPAIKEGESRRLEGEIGLEKPVCFLSHAVLIIDNTVLRNQDFQISEWEFSNYIVFLTAIILVFVWIKRNRD